MQTAATEGRTKVTIGGQLDGFVLQALEFVLQAIGFVQLFGLRAQGHQGLLGRYELCCQRL